MDDEVLVDVTPATERRCPRCRVMRPLAMFYTSLEGRRAEREGRSRFRMHCRVCQRDVNEARCAPRRQIADQIKIEMGCADCGLHLPEHPEVFDFDHRPGEEKLAPVSRLLTSGTVEDMLGEIAKCDVVCANCHRIRTRARGSNAFGKSWSDK